MYTVIPRQELVDFQTKQGEPTPLIIDHRHSQDRKPSRWKDRRRKEQLPYESLKEHRDSLLNAEFKYKHRIKELEKQTEEITRTFDDTLHENKVLRSIIEHGPDAVKLKKLNKDRKDQKSVIDMLKEENEELRDRIRGLEKVYGAPIDFANEKNWKEALEKAKKKRQDEDAIPTQGPFAGAKIVKEKRIAIDDNRLEAKDTYDLELDTVEKETQVLLNKIRQLKREKGHIDYALTMGKGSVSRNATVANAINDKLNRDLNKFAIRLEKLKLKHKAAKDYTRVLCSSESNMQLLLNSEKETNEITAPTPLRKSESDILPKSVILAQKPSLEKSNLPQTQNKKYTKLDSGPRDIKSERLQNEGLPMAGRVNDVKLATSSTCMKSPRQASNKKITTNDRQFNQQFLIKSSTDDKSKSQKSELEKNTSNTPRNVQYTMERYANGPEPIGKTSMQITAPKAIEDSETFDNFKTKIPKVRFPFTQKKVIKGTLNAHDTSIDSYDAVLEYLKHQSQGQSQGQSQLGNNHAYETKELERTMSPVPINFKSTTGTIRGRDAMNVLGNSGLRSQEHFHKFL